MSRSTVGEEIFSPKGEKFTLNNKYRDIFLDLDGTVFDFPASEHESFFNTFRENGIPVDEAVYGRYHTVNKEMWGMLERGEIELSALKTERFRCVMDEFSICADPFAINKTYVKFLSESVVLYDGAEEFCRRLSIKYMICAVTNGLKDNQYRRLELSGLSPFIRNMITSEEAGAPKPETPIFEAAMKLCLNPDKRECVLIGDSFAADVRGAYAFGVDAVWYNPGKLPLPPGEKKPLLEAGSYNEILEFLNV
ncbi:MAG: YjjG family noncanonical pyrimidine nucleotidase [Bacillota bacterium]|nr:YjjG family noncanonical pyrimidine nucleotidase [Bacillota bacterium]